MFNNVGRLFELMNVGIDAKCEPHEARCQLTSVVYLSSPRISTFASPSVELCTCTVIHSTLRRNLTVVHYPYFIARQSEETMVRTHENGSAQATLFFDLTTVADQSFYDRRHEHSVRDIQVMCAKLHSGIIDATLKYWLLEQELNKLRVHSTVETTQHSVRISVHFDIENIAEDDFGDYICQLRCVFAGKENSADSTGCHQEILFSVVSNSWRSDAIQSTQLSNYYEQSYQMCAQNYNKLAVIDVPTYKQTIADLEGFIVELVLVCVFVSAILFVVCCSKMMKYMRKRRRKQDIDLVGSVLETVRNSRHKRTLKYDVFLSYSSKDREWVQTLYEFLTSNNYKVCYDVVDFPYGCSIPAAIAEAVSSSHKVIAVLSPDYVQSGWTEYEVVLSMTQILTREAPHNSLLLIKYKECDIPLKLRCFRYLDYTVRSQVDAGRTRLGRIIDCIRCRTGMWSASPDSENIFHRRLTECLGKPKLDAQKEKYD